MRRLYVLLGLLFVGLVLVSGVAAAETLVGGSVVVAEDETVGDTSVAGGTVVIEGTVDGNLTAYGGNVRIAEGAEVTGIVRVYGGSISVDGSIGGNVLAYGGSVRVGENGTVDRSFGAVAGEVVIAGRIGGDASAVAGSVTLSETSLVEGNLNHIGELHHEGGTVEGVIQDSNDLSIGPPIDLLGTILAVGLFVGDLLLGLVLIRVAPRFADSAERTVRTEPLYTAGIGLAAVLGTLVAILVLAATIVGLPLAIGLLVAGLLAAWVAGIYGQYVVGAFVVSRTDYENRYLALGVGVIGVTAIGFVPYLGSIVGGVVFLLGAGVVVLGLQSLRRSVDAAGGLADI